MRFLSTITLAIIGLNSVPLLASDTVETTKKSEERAKQLSVSGENDGLAGRVSSDVFIISDVESTTAKITFASAQDNFHDGGASQLSLTFSVPFSKDEGRGEFVTDSGLTNKLGVKLSVSTTAIPFQRFQFSDEVVSIRNNFTEKCVAYHINTGRQQPDAARASCVGLDISAGSRPWLTNEEKEILRQAFTGDQEEFLQQSLLIAQGSASWSIEDLKYFDHNNFSKTTSRKSSFSFGGSLGWLPQLKSSFMLLAGAEYKESFGLSKKSFTIRCPAAALEPVNCIEGFFAPPEKDVDAKVFGGIRFVKNSDTFQPLAAELKVAYDFEDKVLGAEVPIYFLADEKNQLRGGFRFGWQNRTNKMDSNDDWHFGIFVGVPFNPLSLFQ